MIKITKALQPYFLVQMKLSQDGFWHTYSLFQKDEEFQSYEDAVKATQTDDFKKLHALELRILKVTVVRTKSGETF